MSAYVPPHRRKVAAAAGSAGAAASSRFAAIVVVNLRRRPDRLERFAASASRALGAPWSRFDAVDGASAAAIGDADFCDAWDATRNAAHDRGVAPGWRTATAGERGCALSHVALWRGAAARPDRDWTLVCEDDCRFDGAWRAELARRWPTVPDDAELVYLGFSDRGDRTAVADGVFAPAYGFATHCYAIRAPAARRFLGALPVAGPVDVWLADGGWHGAPTYGVVVPGRGWRGTGAWLATQDSKPGDADVRQSSRDPPAAAPAPARDDVGAAADALGGLSVV